MRDQCVVCLLLIAITLGVFLQTLGHEFTNYDDGVYVYENSKIKSGLCWRTVAWAFSSTYASNWHPLTWMSHAIDWSLYEDKPSGHHLTSVLFHVANVLLLFALLRQMTGSIWGSGFVAAMFGIHPLHVESVAWIAERKDVLSTFFWFLTMIAYGWYVRLRAEESARCKVIYAVVVILYALGLMSKPMLVTLPFVLLLMDYWPLQRMFANVQSVDARNLGRCTSDDRAQRGWPPKKENLRWLIVEKSPLFLLSAGSSVVTFVVQRSSGVVAGLEQYPIAVRIENALVSYVSYISKMLWPQKLAVFYPQPAGLLPVWKVVAAIVVLCAISVLSIRVRRTFPCFIVGWLWYLGTLVPVIGIVQVGWQAMADRYTYVPLIGLFIIAGCAMPKILGRRRQSVSRPCSMPVLVFAGALCVGALSICAFLQVGYWKDSTTLFARALVAAPGNKVAHQNLGTGLLAKGRTDEAMGHFYRVLAMDPENADAHYNIGNAMVQKGDLQEAAIHFGEAVRLDPNHVDAHCNLANILAMQKRFNEALEHLQIALRLKPGDPLIRKNIETILLQRGSTDLEQRYRHRIASNPSDANAHLELANLVAARGDLEEAARHYKEAIRLKPNDPIAELNLGAVLEKQGLLDEAMGHYERALRLKPGYAKAHLNLGNVLVAKGNLKGAVTHYLDALRQDPNYGKVHYNLANALERLGKIDDAIQHYREAIRLEPTRFEARYNLANLLSERGDLDEAIELFRQASRLNPGFAPTHNNLAIALYKRGDYKDAWQEVHLCIKYGGKPHPDFIRALSARMPDPGQ